MIINKGDTLVYLIVHYNGEFDFWTEVPRPLAQACTVNEYLVTTPTMRIGKIYNELKSLRDAKPHLNCFIREKVGHVPLPCLEADVPPGTLPKVFLLHLNIAQLSFQPGSYNVKLITRNELRAIIGLIISLCHFHTRVVFSINCHGDVFPNNFLTPTSGQRYCIPTEKFYTELFLGLKEHSLPTTDLTKLVIEGAHCNGSDAAVDSSARLPFDLRGPGIFSSIRGTRFPLSSIAESTLIRLFGYDNMPTLVFYSGSYSANIAHMHPKYQTLFLLTESAQVGEVSVVLNDDDYTVTRDLSGAVLVRPTMETLIFLARLPYPMDFFSHSFSTSRTIPAPSPEFENRTRNLWTLPKETIVSLELAKNEGDTSRPKKTIRLAFPLVKQCTVRVKYSTISFTTKKLCKIDILPEERWIIR